MLSWVARCLVALAGVLMASLLHAQSVVSTPQVRAELWVHAPQGLAPGQPVWLGLSLEHQPGWHTYWKNAGDSGLPTQLDWELPTGVKAGPTIWPLPTKLSVADLTNYGFEGKTLLGAPLTIAPSFTPPAGTLEIKLKASWLVCRQECIPQDGVFRLAVPLRSSQAGHAPEFQALLASQPQPLTGPDIKAGVTSDHLQLHIRGWPKAWIGRTIELFPVLNEVVEASAERHPKARQSWQGDLWTASLPLSALRSSEPRQFPVLLVSQPGGTRQGLEVNLPVSGRWPAQAPLAPPETAPPSPRDSVQVDNAQFQANAPSTATGRLKIEDQGTDLTWWGALLGAFLGGLILNLMPCVLPVLAIKALHLARADTPPRVRRQEGWGYAAGVILSMLMLGGLVLTLKAGGQQLGWGFQLQSPLVVSGLALLFTLIALNLWGLLSIERVLPTQFNGLSSRHPGVDAFLAGVLAVAVATPCTAPFMGASIGLALSLPGWQGLGIFAALGWGLALPLLLIIHAPGLAHWLPRPGPWMLTLRQALGFPMLGTVVWLLWVLGQQVGTDAISTMLGLLVLLSCALWALQRPSRWARASAISLLLAWALLLSWSVSHVLTPTASPHRAQPTGWQAWSAERVREAVATGQPVFVDYTAAWCITCQVNKRTTLQDAQVLAAFEQQRVLLLQADWTRQDPAISSSLAEFGRSGVPVYVLHRPHQPPLVLPELLSPNTVLDALRTLKP